MLETSYDIRIKKLKEQKNGVWFPFNKNKNLKAFEFIGRSQSYSIKSFPFLRKKIGTNTCKWWTVSGAFIWIRIWVVASTGMENPIVNFINPIITGSVEAFLLSAYSCFLVVRCILIKITSGYRFAVKNQDVNPGGGGESSFFDYKAEDDSFLGKEWFRQVVIEPLLVLLLGILLARIEGWQATGYFLLVSSVPFFISEFLIHTAKGKLLMEQRKGIKEGEKVMDQHELRDNVVDARNFD